MEIDTLPPMKPVLVERVSDDANVLQKDDVTKQKTVFTARAIEDIFKCAPINQSNATDRDYFVTDPNDSSRTVVDLNKIITASSRTLLTDQYINGPDQLFVDVVASGADPAYAANHTKQEVVPHAFLYTFSVLDTGALSWRNYDRVISIDDQLDRSVDARKVSERIRQVIVPNLLNEYLTFDGTKIGVDEYLKMHRTRYDIGVPWTRVGRPEYTGVTATEVNEHPDQQYYIKDLSTNEYRPIPLGTTVDNSDACYKLKKVDWEDWYMQSKVHNGPEYFFNVELTDATSVTNPMTDSVYHVYNTVELTLPNANLDGYKVGQKIIVEVHPPLSSSDTSSCHVSYQDTSAQGVAFGEEMTVFITPRTRRNTKDVYGNVRDDALLTSVACFEIVEQKDSNGSVFRTWELDGGVEETDFTAGLAQMLGEHTDRSTGDLVKYSAEATKNQNTLSITYPITSAGFVVARFLKTNAAVDGSWTATVDIKKVYSDGSLEPVANTGTPNPSDIYFVKNGDVYALEDNGGHPTSFNSTKEYYKFKATGSNVVPVIRIPTEIGTDPRTELKLSDLTPGRMRGFTAYANRGDILCINISSANSISTLMGDVFPVVAFLPDPHDTYIHKASINPSAFTYKQLIKLFLDGTVVDDIRLANDTELLEGIMNSPVSTRALIEAYGYLAQKLQSKGLLFANSERLGMSSYELDGLVDAGLYWCVPTVGAMSGNNSFPTNMTADGCLVIVATNSHAPAQLIHEEEGTITDPTKATQIAIVTGDPVTQSNAMMSISVRIGAKQPDNTWRWSNWAYMNDWDIISHKPKYFHSRWDYLEDPNGFLNHVDAEGVDQAGTISVNGTSVDDLHVHKITADEVDAVLNDVNEVDRTSTETGGVHKYGSSDPAVAATENDFKYSDVVKHGTNKPVNYQVPQFLVGLETLAAASEKNYVIDVELPDATTTQINADYPSRRRKVRLLLTGSSSAITGHGWKGLYLYVHYKGTGADPTTYEYLRNWGAEVIEGKSIIDVEVEQTDMPVGDRLWCPIEIG